MTWHRDGYSAWHLRIADRPLCTQSYDTMGTAEELPIGAHACSMCVRAMAELVWQYEDLKR